MKRFLVQCGEHSDIIEAESHEAAAAKFWTVWDDSADPPDANFELMSTVEIVGDQFWHDTESALRESGRLVSSDD